MPKFVASIQFGITVEPHEAVVENLNTLSDIARLVTSKKGDFVAISGRRLTKMRQSYHRILTQHEIMVIATFVERVVFLVINATRVFAVSPLVAHFLLPQMARI
jgi:hypothetical protein